MSDMWVVPAVGGGELRIDKRLMDNDQVIDFIWKVWITGGSGVWLADGTIDLGLPDETPAV